MIGLISKCIRGSCCASSELRSAYPVGSCPACESASPSPILHQSHRWLIKRAWCGPCRKAKHRKRGCIHAREQAAVPSSRATHGVVCHAAQARAFSFAAGGLAAAECLHENLLDAVAQAPIAFFDATPTGVCLCDGFRCISLTRLCASFGHAHDVRGIASGHLRRPLHLMLCCCELADITHVTPSVGRGVLWACTAHAVEFVAWMSAQHLAVFRVKPQTLSPKPCPQGASSTAFHPTRCWQMIPCPSS